MGEEYFVDKPGLYKRKPKWMRESQFPEKIIEIVKTAVERLERDSWHFLKDFTEIVRQDINSSGIFANGDLIYGHEIILADYWCNHLSGQKVGDILSMLGYRIRKTEHDKKSSTMVMFKVSIVP